MKRREGICNQTYNPDPVIVKDILKLQTQLGPPLNCPGVGVVRKHGMSRRPGLEFTSTNV